MRQKTSSANFASRTLLELERLLREGGDGPRLEAQPVADIIEAQGMGELHEEHRAKMAEHGVGAGFDIDARFLG